MDDEQENTCDPPGTPLPETESKDSDDKLVDPLQISNSTADKGAQDVDAAQELPAAKSSAICGDAKETETSVSDAADAAATKSSTDGGADDKLIIASSTATVSSVTASAPAVASSSTVTTSIVSAGASEESEQTKSEPATASAIVTKEQEMLSTIANIKQEVNATANVSEYPPKEVPIYIKKEPSEDTADNSNSNSNSNEPHDLKLASDIKSEGKCGLDLTDHENKYAESAGAPPGQPAKYGSNVPGLPPPPPSAADAQPKYSSEPTKYTEPHKYPPHDLHVGMKYPPGAAEHAKYLLDPSGKCEVKGYLDLNNRYHEGAPRSYSDGANNEHPQSLKVYPPEQQQPTDLKYSASEGQSKYTPPISEPMKYEQGDNNAMIKRPPYQDLHQPIRSPYDPSQMIKYGDPMQKFHGIPPHMGVAGLPEMKYLPPTDLKYRPPEGLAKPPFSTDALIKSNAYGEYPGALKYPPSESPIDASARSTPNQDSQSSSSNFPPHLPAHHGNTSSPQTNSPHLNHLPPAGGPPMLLGPGASGMPPHPSALAHLSATHPSMAPPNSSPSATPVSSNQPSHLPPSTVSSPMQQPLGLLAHPGIHRPHQDMPPLMHHPSAPFATGLPPPHSSAHPQIPSPALSVSRSEHERAEHGRRMEAMHHGSSPGLLPPSAGAPLLGHPAIPLHLTGNMPPSGM